MAILSVHLKCRVRKPIYQALADKQFRHERSHKVGRKIKYLNSPKIRHNIKWYSSRFISLRLSRRKCSPANLMGSNHKLCINSNPYTNSRATHRLPNSRAISSQSTNNRVIRKFPNSNPFISSRLLWHNLNQSCSSPFPFRCL